MVEIRAAGVHPRWEGGRFLELKTFYIYKRSSFVSWFTFPKTTALARRLRTPKTIHLDFPSFHRFHRCPYRHLTSVDGLIGGFSRPQPSRPEFSVHRPSTPVLLAAEEGVSPAKCRSQNIESEESGGDESKRHTPFANLTVDCVSILRVRAGHIVAPSGDGLAATADSRGKHRRLRIRICCCDTARLHVMWRQNAA